MNEQEKHHNLNDLLDIMRGALAALGGFLIRFGGRVTFLFFAGNFYGADRLGTFAYTIAIVETIAALSTFGMKRSLFPALKEAKSHSDDERQIAFSAIALATILGFSFASILAFVLWPVLDMPNGDTPFYLFAFTIPLLSMSEVFLSLTRHRRKIKYEVICRSIVEPWAIMSFSVAAYFAGLREEGMLMAYFFALSLSLIISIIGFSKLYNVLAMFKAGVSIKAIKTLFAFSAPTAVVEVIALAFRRIDIFFLGMFTSDVVVGIYYAAQNIATLVEKIRHIFDPILAPIVSQTMTSRGLKAAGIQLEQVCRVIFTLLAMQTLLLSFFAEPILNGIGTGMGIGALALIILMIAEAIDGSLASAELPIVFAHPRFNLILSVTGISIHIAGCLLLIPLYGAVGAALSLLMALVVLNILRLAFAKKFFDINILTPLYYKPLAALTTSALCLYGVDRFILPLREGFYWPIGVVMCIGIYFGVLKMLGISQEEKDLLTGFGSKQA
ncbi:MAG: polysaccharide biosynthesis protein [Sphingomonadales bacterium]|nr:polysaccharide biosynthesis protein [Sphingomonadales bacterium]